MRKSARRRDKQKDKKLTKLWKDWLPEPSSDVQNLLRLRMDDCNWEDFSEHGHTSNLTLIPRSALQVKLASNFII